MPEWICDDGAGDADGGCGGVCSEAAQTGVPRSPVRHGITNFHNYALGAPGTAGARPLGAKHGEAGHLARPAGLDRELNHGG